MKLAESGQLVAKASDWVAPRDRGKARAMTQAAEVSVRGWPAGAAVMNLSTA